MNKVYLGDGLYFEFDGFQIRLSCERDGGTHEVYLEPSVWLALVKVVSLIEGFSND